MQYFYHQDKTFFMPKKEKKHKEKKANESFNASFETWEKKETPKKKKDTYLKGKVLDYKYIEDAARSSKSVRITGPGVAKGIIPYATQLSEERLKSMLIEGLYIDTEALDAALSLLDRKLNEDCGYSENVTLYKNTTLRLIACGQEDLVKDGFFIAVLPREFGNEKEGKLMEKYAEAHRLKKKFLGSDVNISHFTLVSNINCGKDEVNIYETLNLYRNQGTLLTDDQKKLVKTLTRSQNLLVNCINVMPQKEAECAALSVGLAVKLCFSAPGERGLFEEFVREVIDIDICNINDLISQAYILHSERFLPKRSEYYAQ